MSARKSAIVQVRGAEQPDVQTLTETATQASAWLRARGATWPRLAEIADLIDVLSRLASEQAETRKAQGAVTARENAEKVRAALNYCVGEHLRMEAEDALDALDALLADAERAEEERDEARALVEQLRRHGGDWIVEALNKGDQ